MLLLCLVEGDSEFVLLQVVYLEVLSMVALVVEEESGGAEVEGVVCLSMRTNEVVFYAHIDSNICL